MSRRTAFAAAVMAVLLVPLLVVPASAHGEHKVANYTFVVEFRDRAGVRRHDQQRPAHHQQQWQAGDQRQGPQGGGQHRRRRAEGDGPRAILRRGAGASRATTAFFIPTAPGAYTFKITGTLGGKKIDKSYTSGKDGFDEITDPAEVRVPGRRAVRVAGHHQAGPGAARLNAALAADREAAEDEAADARQLATIGLVVGALGLLAAVEVGVVALRRRS